MAEIMVVGDDPKELINEQNGRHENDRLDQAALPNVLLNVNIELALNVRHDFVNHGDNIPPVPPVQNNTRRREESNELPDEVIEHFPGASVNQIIEILSDIQRLTDANKFNIFEGINQFSDRDLLMQNIRHGALYGEQIFSYILRPILETYVYYLLLFNQFNQVMVLTNRNNGREFPKAYRRIINDSTLESPKQAIVRAFNQQVQVTDQVNGDMYDRVDIGEDDVLGPHNYLEYVSNEQGDRQITICCFACRVHTYMLAFTPRNQEVFQETRFIHPNEIPESMVEYSGDFHLLLQYILSRLNNNFES